MLSKARRRHSARTEHVARFRTCHFTNWCRICGFVYDLFLFVWLRPWYPNIMEYDFPHLNAEGRLLSVKAGCSLSEQEAEIKDAWSSTHPPEDDQHGSIFSLKLWAYVDVLHTPYRIIHASCKRKHRRGALARQNTHQATGPLFSRTALRSAHLFVF